MKGVGAVLEKAAPAVFKRATREAAAYHEAGHVAQVFFERVPCFAVSIVPGSGYSARLANVVARLQAQRDANFQRDQAEKYARIALAGAIAQRRFSARSVRNLAAEEDHRLAVDVATRLAASELEAKAWLALWMVQVEQTIKNQWQVVDAVAGMLLSRETITADMADVVVRKALGQANVF